MFRVSFQRPRLSLSSKERSSGCQGPCPPSSAPPPRKALSQVPPASFRKTKGGLTRSWLPWDVLLCKCEIKERLLESGFFVCLGFVFCFFVFFVGFFILFVSTTTTKKKVQMWSSLLHFVTWICNYAFSEKGEGREEGEEVDLHLYVFRFLCPWYPHVWEGERRGSPGQHSEGKRDLPDPALRQVRLWSKFGGVCHACPPFRCRILDTGHAVLTQGSHGSVQAPVFSELRTLSSSGNHAALCWPESSSWHRFGNSSSLSRVFVVNHCEGNHS